jgi:hypothetical protein
VSKRLQWHDSGLETNYKSLQAHRKGPLSSSVIPWEASS